MGPRSPHAETGCAGDIVILEGLDLSAGMLCEAARKVLIA